MLQFVIHVLLLIMSNRPKRANIPKPKRFQVEIEMIPIPKIPTSNGHFEQPILLPPGVGVSSSASSSSSSSSSTSSTSTTSAIPPVPVNVVPPFVPIPILNQWTKGKKKKVRQQNTIALKKYNELKNGKAKKLHPDRPTTSRFRSGDCCHCATSVCGAFAKCEELIKIESPVKKLSSTRTSSTTPSTVNTPEDIYDPFICTTAGGRGGSYISDMGDVPLKSPSKDGRGKVSIEIAELEQMIHDLSSGQSELITVSHMGGKLKIKTTSNKNITTYSEYNDTIRVYAPCHSCRDTTGTCEKGRYCSLTSDRRYSTTLEAYMFTFSATFSGNIDALKRDRARSQLAAPSRPTIIKIRKLILRPIVERLHNESVQKAISEYKTIFKQAYPNHTGPIPVGLSMDGRWQKRWGWNSLDGHGIGHIFCPLGDKISDKINASLGRKCIGAFPHHRQSSGNRRKTQLHDGNAGSIDASSVEKATLLLLNSGLDLVHLLHDNDAGGILRCRFTKAKWMQSHQDHGLSTCSCGCSAQRNDVICDASLDFSYYDKDHKKQYSRNVCCGVAESLCVRHGGKHCGRAIKKYAKNGKDQENGIDAERRKVSNRWHWLCSDGASRYFTLIFRKIARECESAIEYCEMWDQVFEHLAGTHTSKWCADYGTCQEPGYSPTFVTTHKDEERVIEIFKSVWCTEVIANKYKACSDTNAEEGLNNIMIMLLEKKLYGSDGVRYDLCSWACCLFANERGWHFELDVHKALGIDVPHLHIDWIDYLEKSKANVMKNKSTGEEIDRRGDLAKIRRSKTAKDKAQKATEHRKKTRHEEISRNGGSKIKKKKASKKRSRPTNNGPSCSHCSGPGELKDCKEIACIKHLEGIMSVQNMFKNTKKKTKRKK